MLEIAVAGFVSKSATTPVLCFIEGNHWRAVKQFYEFLSPSLDIQIQLGRPLFALKHRDAIPYKTLSI